MPYFFASWRLGIFSCAKNTRLLNIFRTNSPLSPLRFDRLSDVKYHNAAPGSIPKSMEDQGNQSKFLFTLGPRPFWELWPMKKGRKKYLTLEEFKALLLERWSKSHGRNSHLLLGPNLSSLSTALGNPRFSTPISYVKNRDFYIFALIFRKYRRVRSTRLTPSPCNLHPTTPNTDSDEIDSRTQRIMKRVAKVARRYLVIEKMAQRVRNPSSATTVSANNGSQYSSSKASNPSGSVVSHSNLNLSMLILTIFLSKADGFNSNSIRNDNNLIHKDLHTGLSPFLVNSQ